MLYGGLDIVFHEDAMHAIGWTYSFDVREGPSNCRHMRSQHSQHLVLLLGVAVGGDDEWEHFLFYEK